MAAPLWNGVRGPSVRLVLAAGVFLAGEGAGFAACRFASAWLGVACWAVVGLLAAYGWGCARGVLLPAALFLLGGVLALRTDAGLRRVLDGNAGVDGPRERLALVVEGAVDVRRREKRGDWLVSFHSHAGPVPLKVSFPAARPAAAPAVGDVWEVDGWIAHGRGGSDRFGRRVLWLPDLAHVRRRAPTLFGSARAAWERLGRGLADLAGVGLAGSGDAADLGRAILLGRRSGLAPERRQTFAAAGTIHVFAISGLHVMVVAWMLRGVLGGMGMPLRAQGLVCVPLIWAYVVLTGARPSAVRAALMATIWLFATVLDRRPDARVAWSATALLVYGLAPERLFDLGCNLSFAVMLGIVLWVHWTRRFRPWFREGSVLGGLAGGFGVSCAAWVAGTPLVAHAFGCLTPGGLLANLAVIWCAGWMVKFGAGGIAASFICLPLAAVLNNVAAAFTWAMAFVSECVAALPFASIPVAPWPPALCVFWYAGWLAIFGLSGVLLPPRGPAPKRWWR